MIDRNLEEERFYNIFETPPIILNLCVSISLKAAESDLQELKIKNDLYPELNYLKCICNRVVKTVLVISDYFPFKELLVRFSQEYPLSDHRQQRYHTFLNIECR